MNKKYISLYIFLCITLLSVLIIGIHFYDSEESYGYTLKEYNGKIAVFTDNADEPESIIDTDINIFSDNDKVLLKNGITVYSVEELYRLIEDFSG